MSRIDDEIEEDLIDLPGKTGKHRQGGVKISGNLRDLLPLVAADHQGVVQGVVDIHQHLLFGTGMGEFAHGSDNSPLSCRIRVAIGRASAHVFPALRGHNLLLPGSWAYSRVWADGGQRLPPV